MEINRTLLPSLVELLMFDCKMYCMLYVNDNPEGKFLYTETMQLCCISFALGKLPAEFSHCIFFGLGASVYR